MTKETEYKKLSDEELVAYIQKHSKENINTAKLAFTELVYRYNKKYYRLAYRFLYSKSEAEDIVQTAFLKLWANPCQWQMIWGVKFSTWFYRVVINLALDRNRKILPVLSDNSTDKNIENKTPESTQYCTENKPEDRPEDRPESKLEHKQNLRRIQTAIASLPKRQQTALILCFYEELSLKEAAKIMRTTTGAVKSLLMRAKYNLHKQLIKNK